MLKTSSVSYVIHIFQIVIKDSLFEDDRIKLLLAKVQKLTCYFNHSSKASELLKNTRYIFTMHKQSKKPCFVFMMGIKKNNISNVRENEKAIIEYMVRYKNDQDSLLILHARSLTKFVNFYEKSLV